MTCIVNNMQVFFMNKLYLCHEMCAHQTYVCLLALWGYACRGEYQQLDSIGEIIIITIKK